MVEIEVEGGVAAGSAVAAAAATASSRRSLEERLGKDDHLAMHLALFLTGQEVCRLGAASVYWRALFLKDEGASCGFVWTSLAERDTAPPLLDDLLARLQQPPGRAPPTANKQHEGEAKLVREAYALATAMEGCRRVAWRWRVSLEVAGLRAMEGHAAALVGGRWACVVGGFGRGIRNDVWVSDTYQWQQQQQQQHARTWAPLPVLPDPLHLARSDDDDDDDDHDQARQPPPPPPPVYGHSAVAVADDTLLVFGGVMFGGYQGDVNACYRLRLSSVRSGRGSSSSSSSSSSSAAASDLNQPPPPPPRASSSSSSLLALRRPVVPPPGGVQPTSRAYCSLTLACGRVWVLGGLHGGRACSVLEALELATDTWSSEAQLAATGQPPSRRMGHSAVWVGLGSSSGEEQQGGRLVVAGGSDGSDLLRNGRELADVHVLTILPPPPATSPAASASSSSWRLTWSSPALAGPPPAGALGRTHTAHLIGRGRILYFGGSARLSNGLCFLQLPQAPCSARDHQSSSSSSQQEQQQPWTWGRPGRQDGLPPLRRISHVSLLAGRHLWVHGGWHGQELGDACLLDLAPPAAAAAEAGGARRQYQDDEEEEEEEEWSAEGDDDDDDDDGEGYYYGW